MPTHTQTAMVTLTCSALVSLAVASDLRRRIIPNALTAVAATSGLFYHLFCSGSVDGLRFSFSGLLFGGLLLFAPYCFGFTGAGDVKLQAALGAWIGPVAIGHVFIFSTLAGGIMAMAMMPGYGRQAVKGRQPDAWRAERGTVFPPTRGLPYALAMGTGYVGYLIWAACR